MENNSNNKIDFSFSKKERLCSKRLFDKLFAGGVPFLVYPLKIIFIETNHSGRCPVQAAFTVSKKLFRKAVTRSLIKRRMREAYRLNKHNLYSLAGDKKIVMIFIYVGREIMDYHNIENSIKKGISLVGKKIS